MTDLKKYALKAWVRTDDGQEAEMEVVQLGVAEGVLREAGIMNPQPPPSNELDKILANLVRGFMFNGNEESEANLIFLIGLTSTKAALNAYINKYYIRKEESHE